MMDARFLLAAAHYLAGWAYATRPDTGQLQTNCCIAGEHILHELYPTASWSRQTHRDLMILDGARPWSPIDAVLAAGVGEETAVPIPGCLHYVQCWREPNAKDEEGNPAPKGGHTFMYYEPPGASLESPTVIEATDARVAWVRPCTLEEKLKGRAFRMAALR